MKKLNIIVLLVMLIPVMKLVSYLICGGITMMKLPRLLLTHGNRW